MDSVNQNAAVDDIHRVNDVLPQLVFLLLLIGLIALWIYIPFAGSGIKDPKDRLGELAGVSIIFLPIVGLVFLRLRAIWGGVVVNNTKRTLEFPGGGISANGLGDFFKPSFLFQYFTRKSISLDDISSLQKKTIQTTTRKDGRTRQEYTYYISYVGRFGTAKIRFVSEGKRDELYGSIRQSNNMGEPFVRA